MLYVKPLEELIEEFERLPGIGRKTAARLAFYVINQSEEYAKNFADTLVNAKKNIKRCTVCMNLSDADVCSICADSNRDQSIICVVESPKDVIALERMMEFKGLYHVLNGVISPIDGVGPEDINIKELLKRIGTDTVKEVIMATNPNIEGESTAMYVAKILRPFEIKVTRIAHGLPMGVDLEFADQVTLLRSLEGRREI